MSPRRRGSEALARLAAATVAAVAIAAGLAACGGEDGPEVPPTASVAPADAVFVDAVVRPEGEQRENVDGALSRLLDTDDPGGFVVERVDEALREGDTGLTYRDDVEPWLGEHAGIFLTGFAGEEFEGAFVVEVTDEGAARSAVDRFQDEQGTDLVERSHEGVSYELDEEDDSAIGFVDEFLVAGSEAGFREAVDASRGDSLAEDSTFTDTLGEAAEDSVLLVYTDFPRLADRLEEAGEISARERERAEEQGGAELDSPAIATLVASSDSVALQASFGADSAPAGDGSLVADLPADSWLAFGGRGLGDAISSSLERFEFTGSGPDELDAALSSVIGLGLGEATGWMGDGRGFASGTSIFDLGAGLSFGTTDESRSANVIGRIGRALADDPSVRVEPLGGDEVGFTVGPVDAPVQFVVTQRDGRVVAGLGQRSVDEILDPAETLGDSDAFQGAADALGDYTPGFYLAPQPLLELAEGLGAADDPEFQQARPYVQHLDYLIAGQQGDDDRRTLRAVLGLR